MTRSGAARRALLAVASGASLLVAHPPVGWWPTTFLTVPLLVVALRTDAERDWPRAELTALGTGVLAGLVAYGPMIAWLIAPAGVLGWALLVAVQALWMGIIAAMLRPWTRSPWLPVVGALTWVGMDAWRTLVPSSGFGWGTIAYAHAADPWLLPLARTVGASGITLVVVLLSLALLRVLDGVRAGLRSPGARTRLARVGAVPAVIVLVVLVVRLVPAPRTSGTLDVLVVQANDVRHWVAPVADAPLHITTNARDLTLAAVARDGRPDLTVWPESSIDRDPATPRGAALGELAREAAAAAGVLVAGASLEGPDPRRERLIVALELDADGERDRYVKRRLVPFGEYVPLRPLLGRLPPLAQVPRDAVPGPEARALTPLPGVVVALAICFETLYPEIVRSNLLAGQDDAAIVLAITNDASFRDGAEPAQHLAQSRLRAVETGRWVVHAALSGSSAFVDPSGSVHDATPLFVATTIRREVPLARGRTPYVVTGDLVGLAGRVGFVGFGLAALIAVRRRARRAVVDRDPVPAPGTLP